MFIERELEELSKISSHQYPDGSAKWLIRQREHLEALLKMVASQLADALDFGRVTQVNRSFISEELRTQESDMIFRIPFRDPTGACEEVIVYLLIEHQSTVDRSMGLRLLSYMTHIWMEERREWQEAKRPQGEWGLTPIVPIVFYTGTGEWKAPISLTALMDIPEVLTRFVPTFDTLLLDVNATDPAHLTQNGDPLGWLLTILRHEKSEIPVIRQALLDILQGLADSQHDASDQYNRAILYLLLFILHRRDAEDHQDLLQILVEDHTDNREIVDMAESIIQISEKRGWQQGNRQGIEQGIERGARQTSIESTLAILNRRFPEAEVETLTPALEAIEDLNRLKHLNLEASFIETFHAFKNLLEKGQEVDSLEDTL